MTLKAILSDIHGNLSALRAVLADIASRQVKVVYCLGDIVGDGPHPRECLDIVMQWNVVLMGDMDFKVASLSPELERFVPDRSLQWTRNEVDVPVPDRAAALRRRHFLSSLPKICREDKVLYVHGSPRNPLDEYVFPEDVFNLRKLQRIFMSVDQLCFVGHTHIPGVITEEGHFSSDKEVDKVHWLDRKKTLVNVGSVGQPRDGDGRACYVLHDGDSIQFRRIEYDLFDSVD